jgi:hypothetical protein
VCVRAKASVGTSVTVCVCLCVHAVTECVCARARVCVCEEGDWGVLSLFRRVLASITLDIICKECPLRDKHS